MSAVLCVAVERCIACGKCELVCAFAHGAHGVPGTPRIHVFRRGTERGIPLTCLQCQDAACALACPTGALARDDGTGAVVHRSELCIRCAICVAACPFGNLLQEPDRTVAKCDLCGGQPRCAPFCPTGALETIPA